MRSLLAFGLVIALASPGPSKPIDFGRAQQLHIRLSSFQITPRTLHLKSGQPVVLTITNDGLGGHDLTAVEFFAAAAFRPGDAKFIDKGTLRVRGGEKVVVAFIPAFGRYPVKCSHAFHKMLGMSGTIEVTR